LIREKVEAVQLLKSSNKPLVQVARDLESPTSRYTIGASSSTRRVSKPFPTVGIEQLKKRSSDAYRLCAKVSQPAQKKTGDADPLMEAASPVCGASGRRV
jgi:hypothetical protein